MTLPRKPTVDAGSPGDRRYLWAGFASDERAGDRTFAWVDGEHATIVLPRRSRRDATIEIDWLAFLPQPSTTQEVRAALNGVPIGSASVGGRWRRTSFAAPGALWLIGLNGLDLNFSSAASPSATGVGDDTRRLSVAIDRVRIEGRR